VQEHATKHSCIVSIHHEGDTAYYLHERIERSPTQLDRGRDESHGSRDAVEYESLWHKGMNRIEAEKDCHEDSTFDVVDHLLISIPEVLQVSKLYLRSIIRGVHVDLALTYKHFLSWFGDKTDSRGELPSSTV
jgi:hypothetical protein